MQGYWWLGSVVRFTIIMEPPSAAFAVINACETRAITTQQLSMYHP